MFARAMRPDTIIGIVRPHRNGRRSAVFPKPRFALPSLSSAVGQLDSQQLRQQHLYVSEAAAVLDQIADRDVVAERVAFAESLQFFNNPPDVGPGFGGRRGHQPRDRLAMLGDRR